MFYNLPMGNMKATVFKRNIYLTEKKTHLQHYKMAH